MARLKSMKNPLLAYSLARIGVFVVILSVFLAVGFPPLIATIIASMLAFSFSLIFLRGMREASSSKIADRLKKPEKSVDERAED